MEHGNMGTAGLLKKVELLSRYTPHNDTKYTFRALRAIRRIAWQSQITTLGLFQQPHCHHFRNSGTARKPLAVPNFVV
ncbi:MAG: hypothetical protein FVQ85_00050 [Planctomycetes bacterium]|nr:hypothetical protein [Planctomycetota bacterium]